MKLIKKCEQCFLDYKVRQDKYKTSRFCSKPCQMKNLGNTSVSNLRKRWESEDKIECLRKSFEKFVIKKDGCWDWSGCKKKKLKYGNLTFRGKSVIAHRVSYMIHKGEIPEGLWVLHSCDNPPCTNPDHLWLGNALDNQRDKLSKGRSVGEKLTIEKVKKIKRLLRDNVKNKIICKDYNISLTTLWCIKTEKTWRDINI